MWIFLLTLIKKMRKIGVSEIWCGIAVPYPKTKLWDYAVKNNLLKDFQYLRTQSDSLKHIIENLQSTKK